MAEQLVDEPRRAVRSDAIHRRVSREPDEDHQGEDEGQEAEARGARREARDSDVLDLMSRLRASLEEGGGKKGAVRAKQKTVAAGRKPAKPKKRQTA